MKRLAEFFPIRRVLLVLYCSLKVPFMYMFTSCREERIAIDEASKSAGKGRCDDHGFACGNIIGTGNCDFFSGAVRFFPGKGSGIEEGRRVSSDSSFISTEKLHENEPSKNGEHQKIENVSWSLAGRGFLLGHGNSPCM